MRRAMLLIVGFSASALLLLVLCTSAAAQYTCAQQSDPQQAMQFPCAVEDTFLMAISLASYEGPFWEDGTDEEVANVAALVVENQSGLLVERGAVILTAGKASFVFELEALPAGERALVLEKDRKAYASFSQFSCYGWVKNAYPENTMGVTVEESGFGVFSVVNHTGSLLEQITVYYKNFDTQSNMYIGGTVYTAMIDRLQPWEKRTVSPYHYVRGSSRIVGIEVQAEPYT